MKTTKRGSALKKLLDLCDDLQRIRTKMTDPQLGRELRTRLRRQSKSKVAALARDLSAYRFRGPLSTTMREFKFAPVDFQILATLLQRHVRAEEPELEGRLLLAAVFETSFEVLSGMKHLHESAPLRASGLIEVAEDDDRATDLLEARYRISDTAMEALREEAAGFVPEDMRRGGADSYGSNREYLMDLRILHNLYKLRSERIFSQDRWDRVHVSDVTPGRGITRRIDSFWARVRARIAASPKAAEFPALRLQQQHVLSDQELMIVVHLLFQELYEGNAHADAVELLRLVSTDEADLIRNRRLLLPHGRLRRAELLQIEPVLEGREMTGEAYLQDWVVNQLFGANDDRAIVPDEKLDWHLYLQRLDDTGTFFRDLESN